MRHLWLKAVLSAAMCGSVAEAAPLISEIYFNPPGGSDAPATNALEYIELRDPSLSSLTNKYLIFIENENDEFNSQDPGLVENIFDLNGMSFGSNGYLVLAMKNSAYPSLTSTPFDVTTPANAAAPTIAESLKTLSNGAHVYQNRDTGNGYGNGVTSSIGHTGQNLDIEGSGFTAFLISVDPGAGGVAPVVNQDLDLGNDGLDTLPLGWSILDSIGVFGEPGEPDYGRLYSYIGFGPGNTLAAPGGFEGSVYVNTLPQVAELEYVGRVGVGHTAENWVVANLTDNAATGYTSSLRNYAVSGIHATQSSPEAYVGGTYGDPRFPYGTDITVTFGSDNTGFDASYVPENNSLVLGAVGFAIAGTLVIRRQRSAKV